MFRSLLKSKRRNRWFTGILAVLLIAVSLEVPTNAEEMSQAGKQVRVAMFLDLGSTYKSTVPAVTLATDSAWQIGLKSPSSKEIWVNMQPGQTARFSVDGYKVKAFQTADWASAVAAVNKLQKTSDKPTALSIDTATDTVYQIYTGPYVSLEEAQAAVARVGQTLGISGNEEFPLVQGGHYYSVAQFSSRTEAEAYRKAISITGVEARIALTGANRYEVWLGGAVSEAALSSMGASVSVAAPQASLVPVSDQIPALIVEKDVTLNTDVPVPVDHYSIAINRVDAAFIISDSENTAIEVKERYARKYRGNFEISAINGQLALVNEVPLEEYLYSVVSAEVPSSWPMESLKAQAVAARSYALYHDQANKFRVAGLVDTTLSQVYNGIDNESERIRQAVDSTAGEVLMSNGRIVEAIFSSNSGGVTADSTEVWNNPNSIFASTLSEGDASASAGLKSWYYVLLNNGLSGYVREDNVKLTGAVTGAGLPKMTVTANGTNVRPIPMIQSHVEPVAKMNPGDQAVVLDIVNESSTYSWIRGPYTSEELLKSLKGKTATEVPSPIFQLEVTQRGPSGRAIQVKANGQVVDVRYPDQLRSAFNGLPSTLFDIVSTGRYTVQGANGIVASGTAAAGTSILSSSGKISWSSGNLVVMGADGRARTIDQSNRFLFVGQGNGHGLGLSQWGAKGMADAGYDYKSILQHYYQNVTIVKE